MDYYEELLNRSKELGQALGILQSATELLQEAEFSSVSQEDRREDILARTMNMLAEQNKRFDEALKHLEKYK